MNKEPKTMEELHNIRAKLHEEEKTLSGEEKRRRLRRAVEAFEKQYGVKLRRIEKMPV